MIDKNLRTKTWAHNSNVIFTQLRFVCHTAVHFIQILVGQFLVFLILNQFFHFEHLYSFYKFTPTKTIII